VCYSLWYKAPTMLPAGSLEAEECHTGLLTACEQEQTQSNAPEDGRNHRPKHVELI